MEKSEAKKLKKVSGIIIIGCAIAIAILNYFTKEGFDSYIMSIVLLPIGISVLISKPKSETKKIEMSSTKGKVLFSVALLALVSGVVTFINTLNP